MAHQVQDVVVLDLDLVLNIGNGSIQLSNLLICQPVDPVGLVLHILAIPSLQVKDSNIVKIYSRMLMTSLPPWQIHCNGSSVCYCAGAAARVC